MPSGDYGTVAVFVLLGLAFSLFVLALGRRPDERSPQEPYEGGRRTEHKTWVQFRVRYAVLALVFIAFDMEMVFMFPWAVAFRRVGLVAFFDMFVFIAILAAAIAFAWQSGAFAWER